MGDKKVNLPGERVPIAIARQPVQLELFRLTEAQYTNAFEFYESIPRFIVGGDKSRYLTLDGTIAGITRNPDGTALPIEKAYEYQGHGYTLAIKPALIKQKGGRYKALFPGVREETIEFIMFKLAVERGMFTVDGEDHSASTDNFTLFTSVYEIQQELKKRFGASSDSLSYAQVREALEVLQETTYHLRCPATDTDLKFQLLSEFGQMPKAKEGNAQNATLYIRFNAMVAKSILAKSWRAINYESVLKDEVYLSRWLRKMLGLKFTYAAANTTFNIKLTSLINLSGLTPSSALRDNLAYVKRVLASLDIVSRVVITPQRSTNSATRRKVLSDALIVIYPSPSFVTEQIKSNSHTQKLARAVISDTGKPLVEPERRDFQTYAEFAAAKKAYLTAQLSRL